MSSYGQCHLPTPWGTANTVDEEAEGILFASTPSHGGFFVIKERLKEIQPALRNLGIHRDGGAWFEEDVLWAVVAVTWPDIFSASALTIAHETLKNCHPLEYEVAFNVTLDLSESRVKRQMALNQAHKDDLIVVCAWGDWDEHTPIGMVRVLAYRGGRLENGNYPDDQEPRHFLVPSDEYRAGKTEIGFIVNTEKHQETLL